MKYLKKYSKMFESSTIVSDLNDISLELTDIGFRITINDDEWVGPKLTSSGWDPAKPIISIRINHPNSFTMKSDLRDYIIRVVSYMDSLGYEVEITSNHGRVFLTDNGVNLEEDGYRMFTIGHTVTTKYPVFTMMKLSFKSIK